MSNPDRKLAIEAIRFVKKVQAKPTEKKVLTDAQYEACRRLYNELDEEFWRMSTATIDAYFDRLFDIKNRS